MPLEISEIGVHVAVGNFNEKLPIAGPVGNTHELATLTPAQMEMIVNKCVHNVLQSLRKIEER